MKATVAEPLRRDGFGEYKLIPESLDDLSNTANGGRAK